MIVRCPTCQDCIDVSDPNAREADCPACGVVFNLPPVNKRCRICGTDVSQTKRKRDTLGHYYCQSCSAQQVRAGRAVDLTPVVVRQQDPNTEALARAIGEQLPGRLGIEHGPAPIVVYVASQPRESRERSKGSFLAGFFGTAGVLAAIVAFCIGLAIYSGVSNWWHHRGDPPQVVQQPVQPPPQVTPTKLEQLPVIAQSRSPGDPSLLAGAIELQATLTDGSMLHLTARNHCQRNVPDVTVEFLVEGEAAPVDHLSLGTIAAGATRQIATPMPRLQRWVASGRPPCVRAEIPQQAVSVSPSPRGDTHGAQATAHAPSTEAKEEDAGVLK